MTSTTSSNGTTAASLARDGEIEKRGRRRCSAWAAGPGTLTLKHSASDAMPTTSEVIPKLTNGKVTPVSGITARLPATVTASWHERKHHPRQPRASSGSPWFVVHHPAPHATRRGSPRVTRPGAGTSRCSHTAQPRVNAHAAVQPNAPTSAVNV